MIYYTADLHFYHENVLKLSHRPFSSIEEMNQAIVTRWNKKVNEDDTVYILGDIAFPKNIKDISDVTNIVRKLKGNKVLIQGNHDYRLVKSELFRELFIEVKMYDQITDNGRRVILMHYPIENWNYMYYGSYHLHGHIHEREITQVTNRFNVGVDVNGFAPVTLTRLIERYSNNANI